MRVLSTSVYLGPSLYARFPVIRFTLALDALEEWPSVKLGEDFIQGLLSRLPGLEEHGCSYREPGGFVRRLREDDGTWMGHILEHASIELQNVAGAEVSFGKTRGAGPLGHYNMVYEYEERDVGLRSCRAWLRPTIRRTSSACAITREPSAQATRPGVTPSSGSAT